MMYFRIFLLGSNGARRNIAMFLIKIIDTAGRDTRPGGERLLLDTLTASVVGEREVEIRETLGVSISHSGNTMIGVHTARITGNFRESRHPKTIGLLSHAEIRANDIELEFRLDNHTERMSGTICIPNPIIGVEGFTAVIMHLSVGSAEILSILAKADRTLVSAIEGGIEKRFIGFVVSIHLDFTESLVPYFLSGIGYGIHIIVGNLPT